MKRFLVGIDGTEPSKAALRWATRLAEQTGSELILANIVQSDRAEFSIDAADTLEMAIERHLLTDWSETLRTSTVTWSTLVLTGSPDALLVAADHEEVDLIVIGTARHGRAHIGGLAHHLAHGARRPLAIIPEPAGENSADHIVVGVDGSEGSNAAAGWVAALASQTGAEVAAVFVFEPMAEWVPESDPKSWRAAAQHRLDTQWTAPLHAAGLQVRTEILEDFHPVAALTEAAEKAKAGLIVVGASRIGIVLGVRLGRFPLQLIHHAQIPVVLVPPTPDENAG